MKITEEMLLQELRSAQSALNRLEAFIRHFDFKSSKGIVGKAPKTAQDGVADGGTIDLSCQDENALVDRLNAQNDESASDNELALFPLEPYSTDESEEKQPKTNKNKHKWGAPKLSKRAVLRNLDQKAESGDFSVLDQKDVNVIFGYAPTTGGSFVRYAIRRGDLKCVYIGKRMKFLASDVRQFVLDWYDRQD